MEKLIKQIADFIIKEVQEKSLGFQYIVDDKDIKEKFQFKIDELIEGMIIESLFIRKEIADVIRDTEGFDVVLYTDYAN